MKQIYKARDAIQAQWVRSELERQGIHAVVLGEALAAAVPEVPFINALPTVHVADEDADAAQAIVDELTQPGPAMPPAPAWTCPNCGEQIEGQFSECWNCGEPAPPQDKN